MLYGITQQSMPQHGKVYDRQIFIELDEDYYEMVNAIEKITIEIGHNIASISCVSDKVESITIAKITIPGFVIHNNQDLPTIYEACLGLIKDAAATRAAKG